MWRLSFEEILQIIAWKYVWNPALPIIFLLFGLYVTIGTRFFSNQAVWDHLEKYSRKDS